MLYAIGTLIPNGDWKILELVQMDYELRPNEALVLTQDAARRHSDRIMESIFIAPATEELWEGAQDSRQVEFEPAGRRLVDRLLVEKYGRVAEQD